MIEVKKINDQSYRFFLKSKSGNTLLNSVDFVNEDEAMETVGKLTPLLREQGVFERRTDHSGKFLFSLKDTDGKLIGESGLYSSEAGMENGIKNLRKHLASISDTNSR